MARLQVQPGQYVAIEIAQKSRTRYEKALVVQVTASEIVLSRRQRYDLDGFPLARNGQQKQVTSETGVLVPLTPTIEQRIEKQELVDELANMDWMLWMMVPTKVLRKIRALLQKYGPIP
jgi:hypothetical protein